MSKSLNETRFFVNEWRKIIKEGLYENDPSLNEGLGGVAKAKLKQITQIGAIALAALTSKVSAKPVSTSSPVSSTQQSAQSSNDNVSNVELDDLKKAVERKIKFNTGNLLELIRSTQNIHQNIDVRGILAYTFFEDNKEILTAMIKRFDNSEPGDVSFESLNEKEKEVVVKLLKYHQKMEKELQELYVSVIGKINAAIKDGTIVDNDEPGSLKEWLGAIVIFDELIKTVLQTLNDNKILPDSSEEGFYPTSNYSFNELYLFLSQYTPSEDSD